jgi:hypothetical protein
LIFNAQKKKGKSLYLLFLARSLDGIGPRPLSMKLAGLKGYYLVTKLLPGQWVNSQPGDYYEGG